MAHEHGFQGYVPIASFCAVDDCPKSLQLKVSCRCNVPSPPSGCGNSFYGLLGGHGMFAAHMLPNVCGSSKSLR